MWRTCGASHSVSSTRSRALPNPVLKPSAKVLGELRARPCASLALTRSRQERFHLQDGPLTAEVAFLCWMPARSRCFPCNTAVLCLAVNEGSFVYGDQR